MKELIVEESVERLDKYLSNVLDISRSKVQNLIKQDKVKVNGKTEKESFKVSNGDRIEVDDDLDFSIDVEPENLKLNIVYEDPYLMIVNKESGMVVHPAPGNYNHTLVNAVLYHLGKGKTKNMRPGIVHRIDKDTSGLMVVAKTDDALEKLSLMIKNKEIERKYLAIVDGIIGPASGTIDAPIGRDPKNREKMCVTSENSRNAITHFKVLKRFKSNTLVLCKLDTGRTHQIRVHMAYIGHPITNDPLYENKNASSFGQMLHSYSIDFVHPITQKHLHFDVEPPKEFQEYLQKLENNL